MNSKSSKLLTSEGNKRNEKSLHAKVVATDLSKKGKGGKDLEAVTPSSNPKPPAKSRSFNDQHPPSHVSKVNGHS